MVRAEWTRRGVELDEVRNVGKDQTVWHLVTQWFPHFSEHQNHLEGLLKIGYWAPSLEFLILRICSGSKNLHRMNELRLE